MKQRFRLKLIAGAVAVLASTSAQAIILSVGNVGAASFSELVLVAYDEDKLGKGGLTYVRGLGVKMNEFLPNSPLQGNVPVNAGAASIFAGGNATSSTGFMFSNPGDANWTSFLNRSAGESFIRWGVVGRKTGNPQVANQYNGVVYTGATTAATNGQLGTLGNAFGSLMFNANSLAGGCDVSCVTDPGGAGNLELSTNLGAAIGYNGVGGVGDLLTFTLAFKNTEAGLAINGEPAFVPFCNAFDCGKWSINGTTGAVTYSLAAEPMVPPPPPPPPVDPIDPNPTVIPLPAAGWLLLTGLAGMIGLSRRKRNAA